MLVLENPHATEPYVFTPIECVLQSPMGFMTQRIKEIRHWIPSKDNALNTRLIEAAKHVFIALEGNGYALFHIRVSYDGTIYMLEINPNCGVYDWYSDPNQFADRILDQTNAHEFFTQTLIELAIKRKNELDTQIKITFNDERGFYLVAARNIFVGQQLCNANNCGEKNDFRLTTVVPLSRQRTKSTINGSDKKSFCRFRGK